MAETTNPFEQQVRDGLQLSPDRQFYFNSYALAMSPIDMVIVLQFNGHPVATVTTSMPVAKTLAKVMQLYVQDYETKTGRPVMEIGELQSLFSAEQQ